MVMAAEMNQHTGPIRDQIDPLGTTIIHRVRTFGTGLHPDIANSFPGRLPDDLFRHPWRSNDGNTCNGIRQFAHRSDTWNSFNGRLSGMNRDGLNIVSQITTKNFIAELFPVVRSANHGNHR